MQGFDSLLKNNNIIYSIIQLKSPKKVILFFKKYFIIYGFFGSLKLLVKIFIEIF